MAGLVTALKKVFKGKEKKKPSVQVPEKEKGKVISKKENIKNPKGDNKTSKKKKVKSNVAKKKKNKKKPEQRSIKKKTVKKKKVVKKKTVKKKPVKKKPEKKKKAKKNLSKDQVTKPKKRPKKILKKKTLKKKKVGKGKTKAKKKRPRKKAKKPEIKPPKPFSRARSLKLIKYPEAQNFIFHLAGEDGLKIFTELLRVNAEIDEFTLAEKAGLQINYARSLLYKLYNEKLVTFSRERDKKKGWFIYSWKSFPKKIKEILLREKEKEIQDLRRKQAEAQDNFTCEGCEKHFEYTNALENMFFCDTCGGKLKAITSKDVKDRLEKEILGLKKDIKAVSKL